MNSFITEPKELVSDSLVGIFPNENEEKAHQATEESDATINVVFVFTPRENSLIGNLVGVELAKFPKIDVRVSLDDAFNFISNAVVKNSIKIESVIFALGEKVTNFLGPFSVQSTKIVEIESLTKTCVLAVDLIKSDS